MKQTYLSAILAAWLLLKCCVLSGALPMTAPDDGSVEQDALAALLGDKATGDPDPEERASGPRLIVVADPDLWRELRELRALRTGPALNKRRVDHGGQASGLKEQDLNIPILRRDSMRCMVGRVYRPCWEV